ncbi:MAG: [protein-PII] uridylyltransferase [Verrucomicrobiales bacterium]
MKRKSLTDRVREKLPSLADTAIPRKEWIGRFKSFLSTEEARIHMLHHRGRGGIAVAQERSELIDALLRWLYEGACALGKGKAPFTLLAVGGYGRGMLNPGSDLDLMFLRPGRMSRLSKADSEIISAFQMALWDIGFECKPGTRTIAETIALANENDETKTSLIDARLLAGDDELFEALRARFYKGCIAKKKDEYLRMRMDTVRTRHEKYNGTVYLQEPHVKNGCGGLRDYQNLTWVSYVKVGTVDLADLVASKMLSRTAYREMAQAYDFLMRVRNELHYTGGHSADTLTLRLRGEVATNLGDYPEKNILKRIEAFMRDYYRHTRNMFHRSTSLLEAFELELEDRRKRAPLIGFLARRDEKTERFDGFYSKGGRLYPQASMSFEEDPDRMMRAFLHLQSRHLGLSPQLRKRFKHGWALIGKPFRYRKSNRETFEAILSRKGDVARVLRLMHRVGFLGRYIPEFGALTDLVQHEFFHLFTADEHTLTCLEKLDELSDTDDRKLALFQDLFHAFEDPFVLYLALLMHDTGRSVEVAHHADGSAVLAAQVARRMKLASQRRQLLLFLVDHHLTFYRTATSKNLDDLATIVEFAAIVRNQRNLDALLLHSYADAKGTNAEAWSGWKESLILKLYWDTTAYLTDQLGFRAKMHKPAASLRREVGARLGPDYDAEVAAHFENMPERYYNFTGADSIANHIKIFRRLLEQINAPGNADMMPYVKWRARPEQGCSQLYVCSWDRKHLLAKVAGALSANDLNILSADIYLRKDNLVLDIFRVCTTNFEPVTSKGTVSRVEDLLRKAFTEPGYDLRAEIANAKPTTWRSKDHQRPSGLVIPERLHITNESDSGSTCIQIQARDRLGLLYDLFSTIGEFPVDISHARISTEKGAAVDSIYITGPGGGQVADGKLLNAIADRLEAILDIRRRSAA